MTLTHVYAATGAAVHRRRPARLVQLTASLHPLSALLQSLARTLMALDIVSQVAQISIAIRSVPVQVADVGVAVATILIEAPHIATLVQLILMQLLLILAQLAGIAGLAILPDLLPVLRDVLMVAINLACSLAWSGDTRLIRRVARRRRTRLIRCQAAPAPPDTTGQPQNGPDSDPRLVFHLDVLLPDSMLSASCRKVIRNCESRR